MIRPCVPISLRFSLAMLVAISTITIALGQTPIPLRELPTPPPELQELIEAGNVSFTTGPMDASDDATPLPTDAGSAPDSVSRTGAGLAAKTRYKINFGFRSQTNWRTLPAQRELRIQVRLTDFQWEPTHVIWFRQSPRADSFWSNPLVRHEFDHVRLSVDPRLKSLIAEMKRKPLTIRHKISDRDVVTPERIREIADQFVHARFQEALDLIEVRYQELDRQTNHGLLPLEKDSGLYELLRTNGPSEADRSSR